MSRLRDVRERIHQPQFDTLVRGIGPSKVGSQKRLFGNATVGDRSLTNMLVPGQLAADQTYILRAMRCALMFQSLADDAYGVIPPAGTSPLNYEAEALSTNAQAEDLYFLAAYGAYFTLDVGQKNMLTAPLWYIPAGGGPSGFTTENSRHVITNGLATHEAILRLAKDITFAARQNFSVTIEWFDFPILGVPVGGVAYPADLSPLNYLNTFDGLKLIQVHVDGILTRDVQ
jgi:hypothetical protein